ncbi:recombinase family protein [Muricoccus nepalensis]|uniref:recombinase family protein n=1 Tax=Muricoccus nepalensis TaxID=1854500 RepID=UPI001387595A
MALARDHLTTKGLSTSLTPLADTVRLRDVSSNREAEDSSPIPAPQAEGLSLRAIASKLDAEGIQTPRSGAWAATAVRRVLAHVQETAIDQEAA